jgi:hypothetical protein
MIFIEIMSTFETHKEIQGIECKNNFNILMGIRDG